VSVNVAPEQKVTFNLTYQELLQRALGIYQSVIYIDPGQIVNDMKVDVFINESREINSLRVPALQKDMQDTLNIFEGKGVFLTCYAIDSSTPLSVFVPAR
jgi:hypothetical protein